MIKCKVNLYIFIYNKSELYYELVSLDGNKNIPSFDINSDTNIVQSLENTFKEYVDLDPIYTNFVLSDIENTSEKLLVNYYCLVPYNTRIKSSSLIPINNYELYSSSIRKIISKL